MREEQALLHRLRTVSGAPDACIAPCDDLHACDLLVVRDNSAMRKVAHGLASGRPGVRLWILDDAGVLHDGLVAPQLPLDERQLWDALDDMLGPGVAIAASAPPPAPVAAVAPQPVPLREPAAAVAMEDPPPIARAIRERVAAGRGHALIAHGGRHLLMLDFDRKLAVPVTGTPQASALASELAPLLPDATMQLSDAATFNAQPLPTLPLIPLLWNIALQARGASPLLPPLDAGSVLSLKQWPDFRAVAHRPDHFQLCSLLLKRPSTADEACALLGMARDIVHGFFNAAYLSSYAVVATAAAAPAGSAPDAPPPGDAGGSRLSRLWRSVRGERGRNE
ncbi:hypothetical protein LDO26_06340 [Luteimonas sp. BDR2-5]|uniref:hypothetical protein n=1 Tax=Proluteimonas luteida TaxID=2878685 RepID=UPI001E5B5D57|nr:hypothetical protein [Luteimonas sp. BDR2-5]MCD9027822.1 hypothetical protein [Luteimonas sp. BDR2-5]